MSTPNTHKRTDVSAVKAVNVDGSVPVTPQFAKFRFLHDSMPVDREEN